MVSIVYEVAEDMNLTLGNIGADFNAGYDLQPGKGLSRGLGWSNPVYRIMVSQGNKGYPPFCCLPDDICRGKSTIRSGGVYMEVYPAHYYSTSR